MRFFKRKTRKPPVLPIKDYETTAKFAPIDLPNPLIATSHHTKIKVLEPKLPIQQQLVKNETQANTVIYAAIDRKSRKAKISANLNKPKIGPKPLNYSPPVPIKTELALIDEINNETLLDSSKNNGKLHFKELVKFFSQPNPDSEQLSINNLADSNA